MIHILLLILTKIFFKFKKNIKGFTLATILGLTNIFIVLYDLVKLGQW